MAEGRRHRHPPLSSLAPIDNAPGVARPAGSPTMTHIGDGIAAAPRAAAPAADRFTGTRSAERVASQSCLNAIVRASDRSPPALEQLHAVLGPGSGSPLLAPSIPIARLSRRHRRPTHRSMIVQHPLAAWSS
jgi:hypothetical protein